MKKLTHLLFITVILSLLLTLLGIILPTHKPDLAKLSPYECGFEPITSSRLPFSFRFFMVAILFLIFDLEIALLIPFPLSNLLTRAETRILPFLTFILILALGLYYE